MVSRPSVPRTIIMKKFRSDNIGEENDGAGRTPGGDPHLPGNASGDVGGEEPQKGRGADEAHPRSPPAYLGLRPRASDLPSRSGPCANGPLPGKDSPPVGTYLALWG